jgi:tetratricopeptide (TPR) repeat protein
VRFGPLGRPEVAVGLLVAILAPAAYTEAVAAARSKTADELLARGRLARAEAVVRGLVELGSDIPIERKSPAEAMKAIAAQLDSLRKQADVPLPAHAPPRARTERAVQLIALNRNAEAVELLEPIAADSPSVSLLLGHAYLELGRRAESTAAFEAGLAKVLPTADRDPDARALCVETFGALALNAREERRPDEVERVLRRGLEALPSEAGHFRLELGKLYADGGRPAKALEELNAAIQSDPARYTAPAQKVITHLRTHTYGCVLSPSAGQPASRNP